MGPNVKTIQQSNAATPLSNDLLGMLQGYIHQQGGAQTTGPLQKQGSGTAGQQYNNSVEQRLGGINTEGALGDETDKLISAVQNRSSATTERNAAALRQSFGTSGNRFSSAAAKGEGLLRSESGTNLDQTIANILNAQVGQKQAAREFDVNANHQAASNFFQLGSQGILNPEQIVSPSIGQQLFSAATQIGAAYLGKAPGIGGTPTPTTSTHPPVTMPHIGGGYVGEPTTYPGSYSTGAPVTDPRIFTGKF